jgi:hypothetical protein
MSSYHPHSMEMICGSTSVFLFPTSRRHRHINNRCDTACQPLEGKSKYWGT